MGSEKLKCGIGVTLDRQDHRMEECVMFPYLISHLMVKSDSRAQVQTLAIRPEDEELG
jgi:hypothetical protein